MPTSAARAAVCVGALASLFTVNQWSRSVIFYVVDFAKTPVAGTSLDEAARLFMNIDIGFDEAQYGLLASIGFAAFFALSSLLAGGTVDRTDPRKVLALSGFAWSGAMAWQASAVSFADVLGSRVLLGFAQAFTNPAAYTALGKLFAPEKRATVFGIYSSGVYFGGGLAALSILLDDSLGWRGISMLCALVGAAIAASTFVALPPLPPAAAATEPQYEEGGNAIAEDSPAVAAGCDDAPSGRGAAGAADASVPVSQALRELLSRPAVQWLLIGSTFRFMAGFCIGVWVVPFYRGAFPAEIGTRFALLKASVNGVAGAASAAGGGYLTDRLSRSEPRMAQWIPAAGSLLAVPFWIGTLSATSLEWSLAALFIEYLVAECWFGPTISSLQRAAPAGSQGLAQGVFNTLTLAGNLAPAFVGFLLTYKGFELPTALAYTVPVLYVAAAAAFFVAGEQLKMQMADEVTLGIEDD